MRMKWHLFGAVYIIGGLSASLLIGRILQSDIAGVVVFVCWFAGFSWLSFAMLRCPHVRKTAIVTPRGVGWPFAGNPFAERLLRKHAVLARRRHDNRRIPDRSGV